MIVTLSLLFMIIEGKNTYRIDSFSASVSLLPLDVGVVTTVLVMFVDAVVVLLLVATVVVDGSE